MHTHMCTCMCKIMAQVRAAYFKGSYEGSYVHKGNYAWSCEIMDAISMPSIWQENGYTMAVYAFLPCRSLPRSGLLWILLSVKSKLFLKNLPRYAFALFGLWEITVVQEVGKGWSEKIALAGGRLVGVRWGSQVDWGAEETESWVCADALQGVQLNLKATGWPGY